MGRDACNGADGGIVSVTVTFPCKPRLLCLTVVSAFLASMSMGQQAPPVILANQSALSAIEGTTVGNSSLPLAGTSLTLARKTVEHEGDKVIDFTATSDAFGHFIFSGLAPGRYALSASHDGYDYYQGAPLELTAGQRMTGAAIQMTPLAVLSGKVTDEDGNPMLGVTVDAMQRDMVVNGRVYLAAHGGTSVQTDANGLYRLMLRPGRSYLRFGPPKPARPPNKSATAASGEPEQGYVTTYYPGVSDSAAAVGLDVVAGQPMPELNVRLRKTNVFHVRGKVVGVLPAYPTKIAAFKEPAESDEDAGEGQSLEPDGTFDIAGVPSGVWDLLAVGEGSGFMDFGPAGRAKADVTNRDVEDVVVVVHPPPELHGSVRIVPDRPKGNAKPQEAGAASPPVPEIILKAGSLRKFPRRAI